MRKGLVGFFLLAMCAGFLQAQNLDIFVPRRAEKAVKRTPAVLRITERAQAVREAVQAIYDGDSVKLALILKEDESIAHTMVLRTPDLKLEGTQYKEKGPWALGERRSLLMIASEVGFVSGVKILTLYNKGDKDFLNEKSGMGWTALCYAVDGNALEEKSIDESARREGWTALRYAVEGDALRKERAAKQQEIVEILVSAGADPAVYCGKGEDQATPLYLSVEHPEFAAITGAFLNVSEGRKTMELFNGPAKQTPLIHSVEFGNKDGMKVLLMAGANPNATDGFGELTPAFVAVYERQLDMLKILIEQHEAVALCYGEKKSICAGDEARRLAAEAFEKEDYDLGDQYEAIWHYLGKFDY